MNFGKNGLATETETVGRRNKKSTGRLLQGRTWDEVPPLPQLKLYHQEKHPPSVDHERLCYGDRLDQHLYAVCKSIPVKDWLTVELWQGGEGWKAIPLTELKQHLDIDEN